MNVLTALNHEEPDKVPAWESVFTNNTFTEFYGLEPGKGDYGLSILKYLPFRNRVFRYFTKKRKSLKLSIANHMNYSDGWI